MPKLEKKKQKVLTLLKKYNEAARKHGFLENILISEKRITPYAPRGFEQLKLDGGFVQSDKNIIALIFCEILMKPKHNHLYNAVREYNRMSMDSSHLHWCEELESTE